MVDVEDVFLGSFSYFDLVTRVFVDTSIEMLVTGCDACNVEWECYKVYCCLLEV